MIEGLPGTAKTTIAKWLDEYLNSKGINAILLLEGNRDIPCDFY
jgi:Thymidylate kinase